MEFEAAALPNGNHAIDDLVENGTAGPTDDSALATADTANDAAPRGLYLVRIPKPPIDDTLLKKLQAEFQGHVTKLKALNGKLQAKRDIVRGIKKEMNEARGLKETSEPEFQDKFSKIQELRNLRSSYINRMRTIRETLQGFDCKSEAELDEKIKSIEHRITHEGVELREEKQLVQQVAKLNAMRGKIKEYEPLKAELSELETESSKIKSIIDSMDSEFSVIKSERDATKRVVQDIYTKLKAAQDDLSVLEAEQAELVAAKDAALKMLDFTRDEANNNMKDFRDNRKFSLTVRDLVAAGQAEEAAAMVNQQVDEWVLKLSSDAAYRKEYEALWASQRRAPVSDLLPQSCTNAQEVNSRSGPAGAGKGKAGAAKPPPEPRGAEKAKALIEKLMAEASSEAAKARGTQNISDGDADEDDDDIPAPQEAKKVEAYKPPAAATSSGLSSSSASTKLVKDPAAAAAAAFNFKVELPKVEEQEFVPPVIKSDTEQQSKEMIREEQLRKNQEAEERKRKRAEAAERKKQQAAETARRLEAERKERDAAAREAAAQKAAAAAAERAAREAAAAEEAAAAAAASAPSAQQQQVAKMGAPTAFEKRQAVAAAKRIKTRSTPVKQVQSFWNQYQAWIVLFAVLFLCIVMGIAYLLS